MTSLSNMQRKIIFALAILILFVGMYPYKEFLHREAERRDLGEATIGEVDTGSFMLKLALLGGARGIAANVLWMRAQELQKVQDWDKMKATVNLITKLQPHFLQIWTFQGWNLAYNVSVEWDAPEDKYEWIKQGIKFLRDGVSKNARSPDLIWDTAWTYFNKIGAADEAIILRRLFYDDSDESFKRDPIDNNIYRDNFQLATGWFTRSINLADSGEKRMIEGIEDVVEHVDAPVQRKGRPGDLAFRSMPAHAQTRYAASLEKESMVGIPAQFGQVVKNEWHKALNEWLTFGRFTYHNPNDIKDETGKSIKQDVQIDDSTNPNKLRLLHPNVFYWTNRWADQMNYPYWKDRCLTEMEDEAVAARLLFYEGTKAYKAADLPKAVKSYEEGLRIWDTVLKKHPHYRDDDLNRKDTGLVVKRYARACQQLGVPVPKDTPFLDFIKYVEADSNVDPFDALEMTSKPASAPAPVGNAPPGRPGPTNPPQAK